MLTDYVKSFKNKNIGFLGAGVTNLPIIELFLNNGINITIRDKKTDDPLHSVLSNCGAKIISGENYLKDIFEDVVFISPGIRDDHDDIKKAAAKGTIFTSEMNEFFRLCKGVTIGVTGSDGKTTTSTLIAEILKTAGKTVYLGGNIGKNLLVSLNEIEHNHFVVVELSSFQLMKMKYSPDIAVITNISPNHLDWHIDMPEYINAKRTIYKFQNVADEVILNYDDPVLKSFAVKAKSKTTYFSGTSELASGCYFDESSIFYNKEYIMSTKDILLPGVHNKYNFCAAIAATKRFVDNKSIVTVAGTFKGVEHRMELVRVLNGVTYYNSSIDSSPTRTAACLKSFEEKVIVIVGGYDKNIPLEPLGPLFNKKVKSAILIGATAKKIENILIQNNFYSYFHVSDMKDAVLKAKALSTPGDKVVLSPAAASFDLYKNFALRGEDFKNIVNSL